MGVVISSVVAGGPAVLEDLETPYAVIQERRVKQQEKQRQKPRLRRQKNQLEFESNKTVRLSKSNEEKKNVKSNSNVRIASKNSSGPSRPQSRNSKVGLKRQNSLDVSPTSPSSRKTSSTQPNNQGQTSVADKIRMMLSSPKQSKKVEVNEAEVEHEEAEGTGNAVKDTIDTMFQQVTQTLHLEDEKHPQVLDAEHEDQTSITSKTDTTRSVRSVKKLSSKQKLEMLKNLPSARKDEYKTYMAPPRHKKSSAKPLNVKENKKEES